MKESKIYERNVMKSDLVRLSAAFTDTNGAAADPTSVALKMRLPDGTLSTFGPTRDSAGNYHYDYTAVQSGVHNYRFKGTGAVVAAGETSFVVKTSEVI